VSQRLRILKFATWIAAAISGGFGILQFWADPATWWIGVVNLVATAVFVLVPMLYRYGELVAPLTFICASYVTTFVVCWAMGTDSGLQFYFVGAASIAVLILGIERIALAATLAGVGAGLAIAVEFLVPASIGDQPAWLRTVSFVLVVATACFIVVATVWYALRENARAEEAMEAEYERSEALLTNILPASIADRLKDPATDFIADSYDDASVLFADIADFTERASQAVPSELVAFLNGLYTDLDRLVDRRGLEKIKTSGDSYMVVSGVPDPRPDHLDALARLALDIADTVAGLRDPLGQPVSLRIGLAAGPMVAGVVGTRRFFYDVWGDAVNLASRMESTDRQDRIQVPQDVYDRLKNDFMFQERGDVEVKGNGIVHTWYLLSERPRPVDQPASRQLFPVRSH
jgi:adenylate cyclase